MNNYTRRDFIKSAGVLGGGLVMSQSLFAQAAKAVPPSEQLNVALVGMGKQGRVLLDSLLLIPGLRFRAVCDINPECSRYGAARIRGIKQDITKNRYEDYRDLLDKEKDLDAVVIATPDFWHAPQTNDFLKAGVNVYCEKMMSNTKEGARSMVKAMRESGKLLQIGHQRKSNPRYRYMHDVLLRKLNLCGRITNANGQWNRAVAADLELPSNAKLSPEVLKKYGYENEHKFCNWRWYKGLGGGPISDLGAHQIDIFAWMFGGRPKYVMADGGVDYFTPKNSYQQRDWCDNVMCVYGYDTYQGNTARAFYQVLTTTTAGGGYFETFMGDNGTIKISEMPAMTRLYREGVAKNKDTWDAAALGGHIYKLEKDKNKDDEKQAAASLVASYESPPVDEYRLMVDLNEPIHMPHLKNFFNSVRGSEKLNCDAEHAFEAEAAVYKVNEAVEAGKKLYFTEDDFVA